MATYRQTVLIALTTLILTPASYAWGQIYKVTDSENGVVFTDSPEVIDNSSGQSVEEVVLEDINTATPVEARPPAPRESRSSDESQEAEEFAVAITSPANESTVAMGPGNFAVNASASPPLGRGERLVLLVDGATQGQAQSSGSWFIEGALRGPHDLQVQRTTSNGKIIASSETVRIYVLRPSIIGR